MSKIKRAQPLHQGQFSRLVKITQATSRYAERDVLVLMLGHHCGLRVTEISRITVADVMLPSGKLRTEISLREAVTKGCRQRCAYLVTQPLIAALDAYLAYRLARGIGTELGASTYRGLLPHQPLVYSSRGTGMSQNTKRRTLETGERRDYRACDSLSHLTRLYAKAGIKGGSSHSGRRTFAGKVLAATGDMDTVAQLLGHSSMDCSQRYIDVKPDVLCDMFANAVLTL
ncbi:tyrosine-type recombinase/integrase [Polaromonas sp. JS666]|uniref:tyrosine-type recombinase/integrase n=1 Tax=Polaromonas sp. (strain JS666 / ATCC BAA-500) TaxID=296591 RepID=UPI0000D5B4A6|nr:site-specific integrase [Polaromonas sp. JS666]ABE47237.1 phage integrase [Polaromonas sp. JS666]